MNRHFDDLTDDYRLLAAGFEPGEEFLEPQGDEAAVDSDGLLRAAAKTGKVYSNKVPPTIRPEAKGSAVKFLQTRLNRVGQCAPTVDGVMGGQSVQAVKDFQSVQSLTADGVAGTATWEKLLNGGGRLIRYEQRDKRWANIMYSAKGDKSQTIGTSGCGPTSLCIALSMLGRIVEPPELCEYAVKHGHRTASSGTAHAFFNPAAQQYGCRALSLKGTDAAIEALGEGWPVIASMGKGDYTNGGHYICIRDYDPYSEMFYTVDPYSTSRNSCAKIVISGQSKALWQVRD